MKRGFFQVASAASDWCVVFFMSTGAKQLGTFKARHRVSSSFPQSRVSESNSAIRLRISHWEAVKSAHSSGVRKNFCLFVWVCLHPLLLLFSSSLPQWIWWSETSSWSMLGNMAAGFRQVPTRSSPKPSCSSGVSLLSGMRSSGAKG